MNRIYLDNAATTPVYAEVIDHIHKIYREEYGNPSSIHAHGRKAKSFVELARKKVANIFKASIGEIFFTGSASEANNTIIKQSVKSLGVERIISSPTEHPCVIHSLEYVQKYEGTEVVYLPVDVYGKVDSEKLKQILSSQDKKTLVSLMHGNNEIGTINPLQEIAEICQHSNTLFHTDAVQTVGKYDINLSEIPVTFLTGSAHKFHGPKGVGFMYIRAGFDPEPFIHGGAQERNMRAGTENVAGIAGLALALEMSFENRVNNYNHILQLREKLKRKLNDLFEDISFNGHQEEDFLAHVLNVSFPAGPKADLLVHNLDIAGISCSSGSACSSGIEEDSHVLKAIKHDSNRKAIRFSFSPFNTFEEIDFLIDKLHTMTPLKSHMV